MRPVIRSKRSTDHTPIALAAVAITQLYRSELDWRTTYYSMGRSEFLSSAVDGKLVPQPTELQSNLDMLLGGVTEAHLYLPRFEGDVPTHFVAIIKDPAPLGQAGLWRLRHTKVRAIADRQSFGALISWPARVGGRAGVTPVPDVCIELPPTLTPIVKGKGAQDSFITAMLDSEPTPERQQFSHAITIAKMYGAASERMPVWFPNRKDQFTEGCTRISFQATPTTPTLYSFSQAAVRKSVPFSAKKNVTIVATPAIYPYSPKLEPIEDYLLGESKFVLEQLLITSRLVPYVGVSLDGAYVDLYAAFYFLDTNTPHIVQIAKHRRISNCEDIPVMKPWTGYEGYWIPNLPLARILHYYTLLNDQAARAMPYFGAAKLASYNKVFGRYDLALTEDELNSLSQTGNGTSSETQ